MLLLPSLLALIATSPKAPIELDVDATDAPRDTLRAIERIPVSSGPLTLVYPKWIPGTHGPNGPINRLLDLHFTSGGREIPWHRDDVDMYAFHLDIPKGQTELELTLTEVAPTGTFAAPNMAYVNFDPLLLYPAGSRSDDVLFHARLTLPPGWQFATALKVEDALKGPVAFQTVPLTRLVDSPILCGAHFRRQILDTGPGPVHEIDMAGDDDDAIQMPEKTAAQYASLVAEARAFFGATHYGEYHWLVPVSDTLRGRGLEHHECSEDGARRSTFKNDEGRVGLAGVLAHEFTHSWCGKYRRPAGLATPNYQEPMKGELLYVYEGFTQFVGTILPTRCGLWTKDEFLADLARTAASLDHLPARSWRNLQDTAVASQILRGQIDGWRADRRGQDYYQESVLIWLEADTLIRQQSGGKRAIDDFAKAFFGPPSTGPMVEPYNFDDLVKALNSVQPYDWRTFLRARLDSHGPSAPLGGIIAGGWKLVYDEKPDPKARRRDASYPYSLGVGFDADGTISSITKGMPADQGGLVPGYRVIAIDNKLFGAAQSATLTERMDAALRTHKPIDLLVAIGEDLHSFQIAYTEGDKFPHLVRDDSKPDLLSPLIAPHKS